MRSLFNRAVTAVSAAVFLAGSVMPSMPPVLAAEQQGAAGKALSVELGIRALSDPELSGDAWNGTFVYFGNQGNYPVCFRVLDTDSTTYGAQSVLLDANYALSRRVYSENGSPDWSSSGLRQYLNGEFLMGNFSQAERDAIRQSSGGADGASALAGDYVFVLDEAEASNAAYGYGRYGTLAKENMRFYDTDAEYVLRTADGGNIKTVTADGSFSSAAPSDMLYFAPALNLDGDQVAFTYPAEGAKPAYLEPVGPAEDNYLKLTMKGGDGFSAKRKDNEDNAVPAGYGFLVDVQDIGTAKKGVNYSRISGMLVDAAGRVSSYGMLSEIAATGEVLVNVPASTPTGDYTLYVFAEDVKSAYYDHATDYASNFAPIRVHVGDANAVSEEAVQAMEKLNEQKTQAVQKETKKQDTQTKTTDQKQTADQSTTKQSTTKQDSQKQQSSQKQAVAHRINLNTEGNGKLQASASEATVGTVIILTATPDNDWHFKNWQSGDVNVANDNKFTMPDKEITVKAVFEKNKNNHAVKLGYMENSTVSLSATSAVKGDKIKATCKPKAGYRFVKWNSEGLTNDLKSENPITFTMPDNDVTLQAVCEPDKPKEYTITVKTRGQGSAAAEYNKSQSNVWVDLYAWPSDGWRFAYWESKQVNPGGQSRFLMPAKNVTLTAVFEKIPDSTHAVNTVTRGDGGQVWTTAENGTPKTGFMRGEKVMVQVSLNNRYQLNSLKADGVELTTDSRTGVRYFYMPDRDVTLTAVFERETEQEHEAYLVVSGDGDAWTQNAKGENVRYFKEGERVFIQVMSHRCEVESIESRDAKIQPASGAYYAYFDMPKGGATVYVTFKPVEEAHEVFVSVSGDGSAWTTDKDGNRKNSFLPGERVLIQTLHNNSDIESIKSSDVSIGAGSSTYDGSFDMPDGSVNVQVVFKNTQPAPTPTHSVTVETSGEGSAWVTNANGEAMSTYEEGERVYIQTVHNNSDLKSVTSTDVAIGAGSDTNDGYFDMPSRDVTLQVNFAASNPDYKMTIASVNGPGSVYAMNGDGTIKNTFKAGEQVVLVLEGESVAWEFWYSDDPSVNIEVDGRGRLTFRMPAHALSVSVSTVDTSPVPDTQSGNDDSAGFDAYDDYDYFDDPAAYGIVDDDGEFPSIW
ncbi:MAG: DUF6273 domain-containing protein [Lachnospiraceae bacterium]|nr:DUF6273 domain-containing protein [Lachnospiraceae bacterium]